MEKLSVCLALIFCLLSQPASAASLEEFLGRVDDYKQDKMAVDGLLKLCDQALLPDEKNAPETQAAAYAWRAHAYFVLGNNKKARADAEKAIEMNPKTFVGFATMGDVLSSEGNFTGAADAFEKAAANIEKDEKGKQFFENHAADLRLKAAAVAPAALWQAFDDNEVAAEDEYKGKTLAVIGKIESITVSPTGVPQVNFWVDKHGINKVVCEFDKGKKPAVAKLKKGQSAYISGLVRGMVIKSVFLKDCAILD